MKELLRVAMSEAQVREACAEYAKARAAVAEPCSINTLVFLPEGDNGLRAEVVFSKKRVRAPKKDADE